MSTVSEQNIDMINTALCSFTSAAICVQVHKFSTLHIPTCGCRQDECYCRSKCGISQWASCQQTDVNKAQSANQPGSYSTV